MVIEINTAEKEQVFGDLSLYLVSTNAIHQGKKKKEEAV